MKGYAKLALLILAGLAGCKGCDDDPKPKANANFEIGQMLGTGGDFPYRFIANDTIETYFGWGFPPYGVTVHFKAEDTTMDQYEWQIGTDDRTFTKRLFGLDFKIPGTYPVKLKVYKKAGATILVDSVTKSFMVEQRPLPRLYGKWRGSLSFRPDSLFDIWICTSNLWLDDDGLFIIDTSYLPLHKDGINNLMIYRFLTPKYSEPMAIYSKMGDSQKIDYPNTSWEAKNVYLMGSTDNKEISIEFLIRKRFGVNYTPYQKEIFTGNRIK